MGEETADVTNDCRVDESPFILTELYCAWCVIGGVMVVAGVCEVEVSLRSSLDFLGVGGAELAVRELDLEEVLRADGAVNEGWNSGLTMRLLVASAQGRGLDAERGLSECCTANDDDDAEVAIVPVKSAA